MRPVIACLLILLPSAFAQNLESKVSTNPQEEVSGGEEDPNTIYVIGSKEKAFYAPGSAHFIDKKELEVFNYTDVTRVLDKVPGVYIQEEDGLGLRPNIGLRGAHPHRSKKVTLMEDGILIGPAPYSAPAAYYFPATSRVNNLEVFKGPSSTQYGPNSIGGAINMVTSSVSGKKETEVEISSGSFTNLLISNRGQSDNLSWFIQAGRKQGDLLKELPNGEEIGFEQNDAMIKFSYNLPGGHSQSINTKISIASEVSDETYLGVTPTDFNRDAFKRYAASADDTMEWDRIGATLSYNLSPLKWLQLSNTFYHHQMNRNWTKFNELASGADFRSALGERGEQSLVDLLRGSRDSLNSNENLIIGTNDRKYYSQGIQTKAHLSLETGSLYHELDIGLRLHRDQVQRNHSEIQASMTGGELSYLEGTNILTNRNEDTSNALAVFAEDEIITGNLSTKIGARVEHVKTKRNTRVLGQELIENSDTIFVPGVGVNYSVTDSFVLLAGINKGFTLVGPGQSNAIEPEEATNYEVGFRLKAPLSLEAVAFYSDYRNIKGTCSFSAGCSDAEIDREFNGGRAEIYGLESMASHTFDAGSFSFPVRLGYTFTVARFKEENSSDNPEWGLGLIQVNDPMPYVPQNQITFGSGVHYKKFAMDLNFLWKGQMADQAVALNRSLIPSYGVIDTAFSYQYSRKGKAFLRVNNILNNTYLVSLRPFGARPGAPRTIVAGFNQRF